MGLEQLFRSKNYETDKKEEEGRVSAESTQTSSVSGSSSKDSRASRRDSRVSERETVAKSRKHGQEGSITDDNIQKKSRNIQQVEAFVNFMNNFTNVRELLSFFTSEGGLFFAEDVPSIPIEQFAELFQHIHESFPDISFTYQSIEENDGPNVVVVDKAHTSGTHTGTAYCPLPGKLPPIATTGKHVVNDEERWYFEFDPKENGKFKSFTVYALGQFTGPIGLYERLQEMIFVET